MTTIILPYAEYNAYYGFLLGMFLGMILNLRFNNIMESTPIPLKSRQSNVGYLTLKINGKPLKDDDVIYGIPPGHDKPHYFRIYLNSKYEFEMIACTYGYVHNIQPKDLRDFKLIGTYKDNEHLFVCD